MCDTLYAGSAAVPMGRSWFAKNSDRHPAEAQTLRLIPRREASATLRIDGQDFSLADAGLAFALSAPTWMEGGEMGVNERGVAIGNEAVFSRWKPSPTGVLGMSMLRAALSTATSAKEALELLCGFVEKQEQGGNGAYRGSLRYDNSFIISGPDGAFILETAGHRWAWKAAESISAISNAYTIEEEYKRLDAATRKAIAPVNERAACSDEADPGRKGSKESWRALVENRFYLRFTHAEVRRATVLAALEAGRGSIGLGTILGALRSHGQGGMGSPCVHDAGFPIRSATTASLALEYRPGAPTEALLWFTGTSYPCRSLYKPLLLSQGEFIPLWTDYDYRGDGRYWQTARRRLKAGHGLRPAEDAAFLRRRDEAQDRLATLAEEAAANPRDAALLSRCRTAINRLVADWDATGA